MVRVCAMQVRRHLPGGFGLTALAKVSLGWLVAVPAGAAVITCASVGGRYQYCPADTGRGVQLQQQLSGADCLQSQSWGYDRGGVWVSQGCAARFSVGDGGGVSKGMMGSGFSHESRHSETTTVTRRTGTGMSSGASQPESALSSEERAHQSRMDSIRAGMDPDTDVSAAQIKQNEQPPASASDAVRLDADRISNAIEEDAAKIEQAGVLHSSDDDNSSKSQSDEKSEFQANQDFQQEVMKRRADENASSSDSSDSDNSDSTPDDTPKN